MIHGVFTASSEVPTIRVSQYSESLFRYNNLLNQHILTMTLGSSQNDGPVFEDIITQEGFYGKGHQQQAGDTVHFFKTWDLFNQNRELRKYRCTIRGNKWNRLRRIWRFPHWETKVAKRAYFAALHCQLCRVATRCHHVQNFEIAAAKFTRDMMDNHSGANSPDGQLRNFKCNSLTCRQQRGMYLM